MTKTCLHLFFTSVLKIIFFGFFFVSSTLLAKKNERPKLVIYLVFDQMRADYLLKFESDFKKNSTNNVGGFSYLTENGAYFPYAQYDVLQNMTCPGHAMISTGSWPINTGISLNEWYSRESNKLEYCVDDTDFIASPRRLKTTTMSDEFKNSDVPSKVFGIALKDRSAIMLAGHRADGAIWFDDKKWGWSSSSYYYPKQLPDWVEKINSRLSSKEKDRKLLAQKWGVSQTVDLAIDAIKNEKLGKNKGTDFLFLSFSTHDIAGHLYGPNSSEMKQLTLDEDQEISRFLSFVDKELKLKENVQIVLTADHGVPASIDYMNKTNYKTQNINEIEIIEKVYKELNQVFSPNKKQVWFLGTQSLHYFVNFKLLDELKINRDDFLKKSRDIFLNLNLFDDVLILEKLRAQLPINPQVRSQVQNAFNDKQWGDLILIPRPYFMNQSSKAPVNHITGYVYDRTVPLIFVGKNIKKGTYYNKAYVVDIAPTVAALLGTLPGAKTDGHILSEIIAH